MSQASQMSLTLILVNGVVSINSFREEASAERYLNNPADTAPDELLTEIYIPIE